MPRNKPEESQHLGGARRQPVLPGVENHVQVLDEHASAAAAGEGVQRFRARWMRSAVTGFPWSSVSVRIQPTGPFRWRSRRSWSERASVGARCSASSSVSGVSRDSTGWSRRSERGIHFSAPRPRWMPGRMAATSSVTASRMDRNSVITAHKRLIPRASSNRTTGSST